MKLSQVIEELVEERGLDRTVLANIMCEGMLEAYKKRYPEAPLEVLYNKKTDEIGIVVGKLVVKAVANDDVEISLRKARALDEQADLGVTVKVPFEKPIGRIEILRAKQIIAQKIREVEAAAVYSEFKPKEGQVVSGTIHKVEVGGTVVKVGEAMAFLPRSLTIPGDKIVIGYPIRAVLKEVLVEPRNDNQLILDRASTEFLKRLFELEIPEVYEKLVEIKKIVRSPGYKSKVVVVSNDKNVDPVGTCVGVGGSRIKPILRELGAEKIDIIGSARTAEDLVRLALKPAEVKRVEIIDGKVAHVWVDDDQRSVAIGKGGQNIMLASQLTGMAIDLVKNETGGSLDLSDEHVRLSEKTERFDDEES